MKWIWRCGRLTAPEHGSMLFFMSANESQTFKGSFRHPGFWRCRRPTCSDISSSAEPKPLHRIVIAEESVFIFVVSVYPKRGKDCLRAKWSHPNLLLNR